MVRFRSPSTCTGRSVLEGVNSDYVGDLYTCGLCIGGKDTAGEGPTAMFKASEFSRLCCPNAFIELIWPWRFLISECGGVYQLKDWYVETRGFSAAGSRWALFEIVLPFMNAIVKDIP